MGDEDDDADDEEEAEQPAAGGTVGLLRPYDKDGKGTEANGTIDVYKVIVYKIVLSAVYKPTVGRFDLYRVSLIGKHGQINERWGHMCDTGGRDGTEIA